MSEQSVDGLIATLDDYLVKRAPFAIPEGGKEFLVRFGPWISIVFLILLLPILLFALGIGTILIPFGGVGYATGFGLGATVAALEIALLILALPGLFKRQMAGWRMLLYQQLVGIVGGVLSGAIVGALITGLVGLYILFQIRAKYVN
jgi:hypothetical protein